MVPGKKSRAGLLVWGGLSLIAGLPFLAAGTAAYALSTRLYRGLAITAALLFVVWYLSGFHGAGVTAVCAVTAVSAARSGWNTLRVILWTSGLTLLAGGLLSLGFPGFMNIGPAELEPLREMYAAAGFEPSLVERMVELIIYFSPGFGAVQLAAGSLAGFLFFRAMVRNKGLYPALEGTVRFRMHWAMAWLPIICLVTVIAARSNPLPGELVRWAANLLVFAALPYFLEGLQVALAWLKRVPGMLFLLAISAIFATPVVVGLVLLAGVLDTWFDYRKKLENRIERINNEGSSDKDR